MVSPQGLAISPLCQPAPTWFCISSRPRSEEWSSSDAEVSYQITDCSTGSCPADGESKMVVLGLLPRGMQTPIEALQLSGMRVAQRQGDAIEL